VTLLQLLRGRLPDPPLNHEAWKRLLHLADRTMSTPLFRVVPGLPAWVADEVEARVAKNALRRRRVLETFEASSDALSRAGIEAVLLKGFTHEFGLDPALRVQNDVDFLCRPADLGAAKAALLDAGFVEHFGPELSDLHARPLLKPHNWTWRGDYFDPEMPIVVELHHTIWSFTRDRIEAPGIDEFWNRRVTFGNISAFAVPDRVAFAALHVLRHALRNNVRPAHALELARGLSMRVDDAEFWTHWQSLYPARLRQLQAIAFQFACRWFETAFPPAVEEDWRMLPPRVHAWFEKYAFSPIANLTYPNKDVLWLHLALLPSLLDRAAVARRRLLPLHIPRPSESVESSSYWKHVFSRLRYHALALARTLRREPAAPSSASHTSD
jgi:hypothetical protein